MDEPRYRYWEQYSFEPLGQILDRLLDTGALARRHQLAQIVQFWPEVVGEKAAPHATPTKLEHGVLTVEVDSAAWHHHLTFVRENIAAELNTKIQQKRVDRVEFRLAGRERKPRKRR